MHEPLVARNIDEAEHVAVFERRVGIAQLDGYSARFLFLEPIGVHPRQGTHQRGFAVIDVTGSADDHRPSALHCVMNSGSSDCARDSAGPAREFCRRCVR